MRNTPILNLIRGLSLYLLISLSAHAATEPKVALVIGNSSYTDVSSLDNPVPDAKLISSKLESLGFDVTLITDSSLLDLKTGISEFGKKLRAGGKETTGLFYYAGHGVQSFGSNYLLPVDTQLNDAADLDLEAIEASSILRQMFSAKNKTNIVILDACRNNPFDHIPEFGESGLAEMKAPTGTFLSYATAPGDVALDGSGANSPFTQALADEMSTPGVPIEQIFKQVRVRVLEQTDGMQTPWDTSSLTSQFYFKEPEVLSGAELAEQRMWESAKLSGDMLQIMLFLRTHPGGKFESEAQLLLSQKVAEMQTNVDSNLTAQRGASELLKPQADNNATIKTPAAEEQTLINTAQSSGRLEDYQAYVANYPEGIYIELANTEIETILAKQAAAAKNAEEKPESVELASIEAPTTTTSSFGTVSFTEPLTVGSDEIIGKTIEELVTGSPLFPPIEGLPDAAWLGQSCDNCHQWTKEALCTQANVYTSEKGAAALQKKHPYGGSFKKNLHGWATGGCQ